MEKARRRIEELVQRAQILIIASHSTEILTRFCSKLLWLDKGKARLYGDTREVLREDADAQTGLNEAAAPAKRLEV